MTCHSSIRHTMAHLVSIHTVISPGLWRRRRVAVKVVSGLCALSPGGEHMPGREIEAAEQEATLGLRLQHPNICSTLASMTVQQGKSASWSTFIIMGE